MKSTNLYTPFFCLIVTLTMASCEKNMSSTQITTKLSQTIPTRQAALIAVGESYCGGIIFYVDSTKKHGLIAAGNQMLYAKWGCYGKVIGTTSTAVGAGQANTLAIINTCDSTNIAARVCNDLVLNGYSDWFLPSKGELELLYKNKALFRGIKTDYYWSSTEVDDGKAACQDFYDGHRMKYEKSKIYNIRAVRAF
jgi:hypothetical protein